MGQTNYTITSLDAALDILESMAEARGDWQRLSEISKRVAMTKNRVFRILSTLQARGYVEQDPATQAYRLGLSLFHLGHRARSQLHVHEVALPYLTRLAQATEEVAHLLVRRGLSAICIAHRESDRRLIVSDRIGEPIPLHIGASPKILLAHSPEPEREAILQQLELTHFTDKTIVERDSLRTRLDQIVEEGVSIDQGDFEDDTYAVGAPVFDHAGMVIAGVTVTYPSTRFSPETESQLVEQVRLTAGEISRELGYLG
ncbi:MAG: IclR family transcriptional regulator [Chloroflexi bacterium]|nr:IclR family transcriptional regulator [Chloroflexota bacterium]